MPEAAYLHIPFCRHRCHYCDFPIAVLGSSTAGKLDRVEQYLDWLCQEICLTPARGRSLTTIFFGGGTPSLLSAPQLSRILDCLNQQFGIAAAVEISIEMDPGTFDLSKLKAFQTAGVNRVSLGAQAFQDELLRHCGRSHRVADIYQAVEWLQGIELKNFSLDLISGLPHQSMAQWQSSLEQAIALAPAHLSSYDLVLEPDTVFGQRYQPEERPLPSDECSAQMYRLAQQTLTQAGYEHYEISNYACSGFQCRHNRVYWTNRPYYGFGMGAASYLDQVRFTRPQALQKYGAWVQSLVNRLDFQEETPLDPQEQLLETLMLGLRLREGIDVTALSQQFGLPAMETLWQTLFPYVQSGLVEAIAPDGQWIKPLINQSEQWVIEKIHRLRLADPEGFLVSNTILADIFAALSLA